MEEHVKRFINIYLWSTIFVLLIRSWISIHNLMELQKANNYFQLIYEIFGYIGEAIGFASLFMVVFVNWAWKTRGIRLIHNVPILHEKYEGILKSSYDSSERKIKLTIYQTYFKTEVKILTDESTSGSIVAKFCDLNSIKYLIYTYHNDPQAHIQERSPVHFGTAMIDVSDPKKLEGNYFTGRKTRGHMKLNSTEI